MKDDSFILAIKKSFIQFYDNLISALPLILKVLVIITLGLLIAWLVKLILTQLSKRLDKLKLEDKLWSRIDRDQLKSSAELIIRAIYWLIVIMFITVATEVLNLPVLSTWLGGILKYFPNIMVAVLLVFLGIVGGKVLANLIVSKSRKSGLDYRNVLGRFIQYSIIVISLLMAVDQIGVDISIIINLIDILLAALLFGASLAFGLGAKTSVSNILATYYLKSSYNIGNHVRIQDTEGRIIQIKSDCVILETEEGQLSVPAKKFSENASLLIKKD